MALRRVFDPGGPRKRLFLTGEAVVKQESGWAASIVDRIGTQKTKPMLGKPRDLTAGEGRRDQHYDLRFYWELKPSEQTNLSSAKTPSRVSRRRYATRRQILSIAV